MAQILVRDIDDSIIDRLKARAREHNRSLEAEVRWLLGEAAAAFKLDHDAAVKSLSEMRSSLKGHKLPNSTELIREDRDR